MIKDKYVLCILKELKRIEETEVEYLASTQPDLQLFIDACDKWAHACAAFGPMTYDEFIDMGRKKQKRHRGRPPVDSSLRAEEPMFLAARDVDRIKSIWRICAPNVEEPPVPHLEIAAKRNKVDEAGLGELLRRPRARRHDRRARRQ